MHVYGIYIYVRNCAWFHVCIVCMCTGMCAYICGEQWSMLGIFICYLLPYVLRHGLPLNPEFTTLSRPSVSNSPKLGFQGYVCTSHRSFLLTEQVSLLLAQKGFLKVAVSDTFQNIPFWENLIGRGYINMAAVALRLDQQALNNSNHCNGEKCV